MTCRQFSSFLQINRHDYGKYKIIYDTKNTTVHENCHTHERGKNKKYIPWYRLKKKTIHSTNINTSKFLFFKLFFAPL